MRRLFLLPAVMLAGAASPALADCRADFVEVVVRHVNAGPFRVTFATTVDGKPQTTSVEVVRPALQPARYAFHGIALLGPRGPFEDGPIIIGREMWGKYADGWVKMPGEVKPGERNALYNDLAERHDTAESVDCRGRVEREGIAYDAYAFASTHWIGSWQAVWETVVYVDPETGLPALEEVTARLTDLPDQPPQEMTLTYVYDPGIAIEAPE
jgi:septum formation topological specificity factor MinE